VEILLVPYYGRNFGWYVIRFQEGGWLCYPSSYFRRDLSTLSRQNQIPSNIAIK